MSKRKPAQITSADLITLLQAFDPTGTRPVFLTIENLPDVQVAPLHRISLTCGTDINSLRLMLYGTSKSKANKQKPPLRQVGPIDLNNQPA